MVKQPRRRVGGRAKTLCGINPRAWVEKYAGNRKAVFVWPCGFKKRMFVVTGPQRRLIGELGAQFMARRFLKENGGVTAQCPRCLKRAEALEATS